MHGNKYYAKLYPVNLKICVSHLVQSVDNYFSVLSLERIIINNWLLKFMLVPDSKAVKALCLTFPQWPLKRLLKVSWNHHCQDLHQAMMVYPSYHHLKKMPSTHHFLATLFKDNAQVPVSSYGMVSDSW